MDREYGGVFWTDHAIERLKEREIKQGDAWATFRRPDNSRYSKKKKVYVYTRSWPGEKIEVVAKQNRNKYSGKKEWVILSVWSRKVKRKSNKREISGFWGKVKRLFKIRSN